jgi:hypothetical protein
MACAIFFWLSYFATVVMLIHTAANVWSSDWIAANGRSTLLAWMALCGSQWLAIVIVFLNARR